MFELIKELTELVGPVGQEAAVQARMEALWRAAGAEVTRTRIGNVVAHAGGRGPRVLLIAHGDELCYLVRAIDDAGFLVISTAVDALMGGDRVAALTNTSIDNGDGAAVRAFVAAPPNAGPNPP